MTTNLQRLTTTQPKYYQKTIKQTLKQCNKTIQKCKYTNMNPTAPNV
jgi:hypothetical protein